MAGAALDVFVPQPYDGPLLRAPNVVVTPHLAASTDEAQDRAGLIVAEQVAAALDGGLVTNAVNIPTVGADDLEVLGPYIPLAAKLGRFAMALGGPDVRRLTIEVYGELADYDTRLLTVAALNGAFQGQTDQPVNYVNAPVVAADRGVEVVEEKRRSSRDFTNLVAVTADGARVAGTTIGNDDRHWLVSALGFELEMELAPRVVLLRYDDVPGVIGRVGTLFAESGVNIANMAVSRNREGGQALMALTIDSPAPAELLERLREGVDDALLDPVTSPDETSLARAGRTCLGGAAGRRRRPRVEEFTDGTPTARAAAEAVGCEFGQIVKSLVLVCDGAYVLALVPGDRRADMQAIGGALGPQTSGSRSPRR